MALGSTILLPYNVCVLDCHNVFECCPQAKNPVHAAWEERLARYSRIAREVLAQGADFDMGYVRVCAAPLAAAGLGGFYFSRHAEGRLSAASGAESAPPHQQKPHSAMTSFA